VAGVEFPISPLTCVVALTTLSHYRLVWELSLVLLLESPDVSGHSRWPLADAIYRFTPMTSCRLLFHCSYLHSAAVSTASRTALLQDVTLTCLQHLLSTNLVRYIELLTNSGGSNRKKTGGAMFQSNLVYPSLTMPFSPPQEPLHQPENISIKAYFSMTSFCASTVYSTVKLLIQAPGLYWNK